LFDKYGNYDDKYVGAEDYDLWLRFWKKGAKFSLTAEFLYLYRQHKNMSKMKTKSVIKKIIKLKINAIRNYKIHLGFKGWIRLIGEIMLLAVPKWIILKLIYMINYKMKNK